MEKVWTYVIDRSLSNQEADELVKEGRAFVAQWTAHDQPLDASFELHGNRIIVVRVNEQVFHASGCGIDKLQRFIKALEQKLSVRLMDRLLVAFRRGQEIDVFDSRKTKDLLEQKVIGPDTIVFDSSVSDDAGMKQWEQPLNKSWLKKYLIS